MKGQVTTVVADLRLVLGGRIRAATDSRLPTLRQFVKVDVFSSGRHCRILLCKQSYRLLTAQMQLPREDSTSATDSFLTRMWVRKQGSRVTAVVCYTVQDWACFVRRLQNLRRHLFAPTKDQITKRIGFGSRIGTIRIHALELGRTRGRRARVEANVRMIRNRKKYLKFDCKITALQLVFFPRTARSIPSKVFGERIQLDRDKRAYLP